MSTAPVRRRLAGVAVLCGLLAALIPETPPLAAQAAGPDVSLLRELRWRKIRIPRTLPLEADRRQRGVRRPRVPDEAGQRAVEWHLASAEFA